jgi:uncharacterized membrane protein
LFEAEAEEDGMKAPKDRRATARAYGRWLLHPFFISIGAALLIAAFPSDIMYSQTSLMEWSNASEWLIATGLVLALVAAIVFAIELVIGSARPISWLDFALLAVAAVLSIFNAFVHSRDAWSSVVPQGIWLSGVSALLLVIVGLRGWSVTASHSTGLGDRA